METSYLSNDERLKTLSDIIPQRKPQQIIKRTNCKCSIFVISLHENCKVIIQIKKERKNSLFGNYKNTLLNS